MGNTTLIKGKSIDACPNTLVTFEWFALVTSAGVSAVPGNESLKFWLPRQTMSVARLTARLFVSIGTSPAPKK